MDNPDDRSEPQRHVLDATALLCLLFDDKGAREVEAVLPRAMMSAVNYREVLTLLVRQGAAAEEASIMLAQLAIEIVSEDPADDEAGASLRLEADKVGLSPAEQSCLTLALRHSAVAVTTDPRWSRLQSYVKIKVVG